jgi:AAA15 family ATPase/GTPase
MIIEFSVKNYRSIKELQTLSMVAAPIKSKYPDLDQNNIIPVSDKLSLLKSVAIYGANGSGKSNLVKALITMFIFIDKSFQDDEVGKRIIEPFAFDKYSFLEPTFFQLLFICDQVKYRYGFEVRQNTVISEWLFGTPGKKEVYFFTREGSKIQINEDKFEEGKGLIDKTSSTNLFLNVCKAFNGKISKLILDFFRFRIGISAGVNDTAFRESTLIMMKDTVIKQQIISLLNVADFGIQDINNKRITANDLPDSSPVELRKKVADETWEFLLSKRPLYNENGEIVGEKEIIMETQESDGTMKFFNYSGAVLDALMDGGALFIDEFDARLHPMLTKKLVEMFNSPILNKKGAQLVFVTHDTNLLDNSLLRRDQIYFTEKNKMQETILYSLADFKGVRNDASYEKDYINGKYGAIPFLGDFEKLFQE